MFLVASGTSMSQSTRGGRTKSFVRSIGHAIGYDDAWILRHSCNEKVVHILAIQAM